ncbi:TIR domain-containing protein [uncultured Eubacterium sp.]|uniref:TIR domain-containing protein n=1 Tax=uncultured Eubacterium sp. TaxID=165185 RepID=UPI003443A4D0
MKKFVCIICGYVYEGEAAPNRCPVCGSATKCFQSQCDEIVQDAAFGESRDGYVFISYSSKNQQIADSVRLLLMEKKIPCWMAPYDIPAGSSYAYVINDALEKCSCFLLLLTNDSQKSQFVEREVERAITYKKPILPMQLEKLELNSGFKFYIGNSQIVAVPEIRADAPEFLRILSGIKKYIR